MIIEVNDSLDHTLSVPLKLLAIVEATPKTSALRSDNHSKYPYIREWKSPEIKLGIALLILKLETVYNFFTKSNYKLYGIMEQKSELFFRYLDILRY